MADTFFPALSRIISVDQLPSELNFLQGGLNNLLNSVFYRNLRITHSASGETISYDLDIISYKQIGIDIPGTGFSIAFNRNFTSGTYSVIPISVTTSLGIRKYIKNFDISSFSFSPSDLWSTAFNIFDLTDYDLVANTASIFISGLNQINQLATTLKNNYGLNITLPVSNDPDTAINQIITAADSTTGFDLQSSILSEYITNSDSTTFLNNIEQLFNVSAAGPVIDTIKNLFVPKISTRLQLQAQLLFPRTVLVPLSGGMPILPDTVQSALEFDAEFYFSTNGGIGFDGTYGTFNLVPGVSAIGNTGLTIAMTGLQLELSHSNPNSASANSGFPIDFAGVFIKQAIIGLPFSWFPDSNNTAQIVGSNLLIGSGGFSGTVALDTTSGNLFNFNIGSNSGFAIAINDVSVTFQQNSIIASEIKGVLTIPGFSIGSGSATIGIDIQFRPDGTFTVTASPNPPLKISIPGVLDFNINTLEVGENTSKEWFVALSGSLDFTANIPALGNILPKGIAIKKLLVYQDGRIEFEGGAIILPKPVTLTIGPVSLSISALSFGSWENTVGRKYHFFGFDGGINVNPGGVDVRANGVKFYYSDDSNPSRDIFVRIEGIAIDIIIPGDASPSDAAVLLHGFLTMKNPDPTVVPPAQTGTQYVGGISVSIPKAGISGTANMALNPNLPSFLIDMDLEISVPIPIAPGLGIYGFRGLIGQRYVADKTNPTLGLAPDADWYQYYKLKVNPDYKEGIQVEKFEQEDGFSLGVGASFATTGDSGKTFSSKLFFLLSLPNVFLLQGQAGILRQRIGLDTTPDPPFSLFIAITDQYVQASFGAHYLLTEDSGNIAHIDGEIDMAFPFHSNGWYVNFGQDTPQSKRILVRLLNIFDAYFYLMLNAQGIRAGAGASYSTNQNFGPVALYLTAYLDVAGRISFEPKQIGGSIDLGGSAGIKVFKFKLGFNVSASLAAESPHPFDVTGSVSITINLPWPFKNIGITVSFTWTFDTTLQTGQATLIDLSAPTFKQPGRALNVMSNDSFSLFYGMSLTNPMPLTPSDVNWGTDAGNGGVPLSQGGYTLPLDSFIDLEFLKGMLPQNTASQNFGGVTMGANYVELIGPQQAKSSIVMHNYILNDIKIYSWNPTAGAWAPYDIYEALTPQQDLLALPPSAFAGLKSGFWQLDEPNKYNKLRVLSQTPFSYLINQAGNPIAPETMGINISSIGCAESLIPATCVNFDGQAGGVGTPPYKLTAGKLAFYKNVLLQTVSDNAVVVAHTGFGHADALEIGPGDTLEIFFTSPAAGVCLYLSTANNVILQAYQKVQRGKNSSSLPIYTYTLVDTKVLNSSQLSGPICYNNGGVPIDKITITAGVCGGEKGTASGGDQGLTCTDNTPQARQFLIFLKTLCKNKDLTRPSFKLHPTKDSVYNGVYQNTVLYTPPKNKDYTLKYQSSFTDFILTVSITDNFGFSCGFMLQGLTPTQVVDFADITSFQNLRLNPSDITAGNNYDFLVDAVISTPARSLIVTLQGTSCYPIASCVFNCGTFVYQICSLSLEDYLYNQSVPTQSAVTADNMAMADAINNTLQPIWRPNTIYAIQMSTLDIVTAPPGHPNSNYPAYFTFGFQTAGPVGFFHQSRIEYKKLAAQDLADEYKLANLKDYIDYTKSYPNADGNILSAKPLFYKDPQLLLFYVENYVYAMFGNWAAYNGLPALTGNLQVTIKDPAESVSPPVLSLSIGDWKTNTTPTISKDVMLMSNMLQNGDPCSGVSGPLTPMGINNQIDLTNANLKPLKLYNALFYNIFSGGGANGTIQEVHRYNFQTSEYANFTEQIQSYVLDPVNSVFAIFDIDKAFTPTNITNAQAVINGTLSPLYALILGFEDEFDRLIDGALQLGAIDPAQTTDFNIIRDTNTGNILGILVRNPEPFNDPKLPPSVLNQTLTVLLNSFVSGFTMIFSKDRAKAFITNSGPNSLNMSTGNYLFTFQYILYNGTTYAPVDTETVQFTIS
jgi:hypothetical protein